MPLLRSVFHLTARVLVVLLGLLAIAVGLARVAAPLPVPGEAIRHAEEVVAMAMLQDVPRTSGHMFFSVDGRDPDGEFMKILQLTVPALTLRPISQRTSENDKCDQGNDKLIMAGACQFDDFIHVDFLTMPLWRTAVIRANTAACGNDFTLIKVLENWRVVSHRWLCS